MTITLALHNATHTTTFASDDLALDVVIRAFVNLLLATGYSRENIVALFKDGDPNRWDSAWPVEGKNGDA